MNAATNPRLHATLDGIRPLCGLDIELDPTLDSASPECLGLQVCTTCHIVSGHLVRENARRPSGGAS